MSRTAVLGVLVVAVFAAVFSLPWILTTSKTHRCLLHPGIFRRVIRLYRTLWMRPILGLLAWPHLVDVMLGTRRSPVAPTVSEEVWRLGSFSLRRYDAGSSPHFREPLLLVHAVVTKPWILDLTPSRSLARHLLERGFDVFLLDWGDPGPGDALNDLSHYVGGLAAAEEEILRITGAEKIHLIGYCMGGTLCLARAAALPHDRLGSIAALAAPVDFAVPGGLRPVLSNRWLRPSLAMNHRGLIAPYVVREAFHLLRPRGVRTLAKRFGGRGDPEFVEAYGPLARWVWEHRSLPGALFLDIVDLFRTNALFEGQLEICGTTCDLASIRASLLVAIAERDHIVPGGSAHALATVPGIEVEVLSCATGHVSMIAGSGGRNQVWPKLSDWLEKRQAPKKMDESRKRQL